MNINASIVDQRVRGLMEEYSAQLPSGDESKKKSAAFVLLCMHSVLSIDLDEAVDMITEGGEDAGIDGLHVSEIQDDEFTVSIFQGKYKQSLEGDANFPENSVIRVINTVGALFDPDKPLSTHSNLKIKVEEIRSMIRDGYIPTVHVVLCNNGKKWTQAAEDHIKNAGLDHPQVRWSYINHDDLVRSMQSAKAVDDTIQLTGKIVVENFNFRRVLIGRVPVTEISALFERHGDRLLQRNIRRFLGVHGNRINLGIHETLIQPDKRTNFYFFNNGITMICNKFSHNALQEQNHQLKIWGMQIINGGQTCKTIQQTLSDPDLFNNEELMRDTYVMIRLYELSEDDLDFVRDITYATNSQNPVDLRDLRSNDSIQQKLEIALKDLGYTYKRQRDAAVGGQDVITSAVAAEAVMAIWRQKPHQAKFRRTELFGSLYEQVFNDSLNAAQVIIAVLIFRMVENERKRPKNPNPPEFLPYASHFIAMLVGRLLLRKCKISLKELTHQNINIVRETLENNYTELYEEAIKRIDWALLILQGKQDYSLQRLSATFRRGDLLAVLSMEPEEILKILEKKD